MTGSTRQTIVPYVLVLATLGLAAVGMVFGLDIRVSDDAPVNLALPDRVGEWRGDGVWFCHERDCRASSLESELEESGVCPRCGGGLRGGSIAEYGQLPPDTVIVKKRYTHPRGETLSAGIVLSGRERSSLHRPQVCLTDGGQDIVGDRVLRIPLADGRTLKVMQLDLSQPVQTPDGRRAIVESYYSYWFAGNRHETPHHGTRMFWMALDKVLHSTAHRWAYISISGRRTAGEDAHLKILEDFLRAFYPALQPGGHASDAESLHP